MTDLIVLPTVVPALTAAFLLLAVRYDLKRQRLISVAATAGLLAIAIALYVLASDGAPRAYRLGDWPAPFGIVLVLDRLSATMLVLTAALALCVVALCRQWLGRARAALPPAVPVPAVGHQRRLSDRRCVQPVRVLRGDADRVLRADAAWRRTAPAAGGVPVRRDQPARLDAVPVRGRADLRRPAARSTWPISRVKAPLVSPSDAALLRTGVLLLFLVFAIKAALVPLHWWLPATYAAASAPAAALFMIMTKVGVYAMLRVYGTVFGVAAGPLAGIAEPWILPAALATVVVGTIGILASRALLDLVAFAIVGSMGMLLIAVGVAGAGGRHDGPLLPRTQHAVGRGAVSARRSDRRAARAHPGPARAGPRNSPAEPARRVVPARRDGDSRPAAAFRVHRQADDPRSEPRGGSRAVDLVSRARHDAGHGARLRPRRQRRFLEYRARRRRRGEPDEKRRGKPGGGCRLPSPGC